MTAPIEPNEEQRVIEMLTCSLKDYMKLASDHALVQFAYYGPAKDALLAAEALAREAKPIVTKTIPGQGAPYAETLFNSAEPCPRCGEPLNQHQHSRPEGCIMKDAEPPAGEDWAYAAATQVCDALNHSIFQFPTKQIARIIRTAAEREIEQRVAQARAEAIEEAIRKVGELTAYQMLGHIDARWLDANQVRQAICALAPESAKKGGDTDARKQD